MEELAQELIEKLDCKIAFEIPLFGGIPVPESAVVTWMIIAGLALVCAICTRNLQVVPTTKRQLVIETIVEGIQGFFYDILGKKGSCYIPLLATIAIYIGCADMIGIFGLTPPTKDLNVTAGVAIVSIFMIEFSGIRAKGAKGFVKSMAEPMPLVVPLNILEIFIRPLSLCMRLFGNILGGFVVMELIRMVVPAIVPVPFHFYFDFFDGLIQAYVFVFLTALFINEAIETE